jgi:hypothetical protein
MSYTEMMVFDAKGDALGGEEFKNSHFHGPVIWFIMAEKYGVIDRMKRELMEKHPSYADNERSAGYSVRGHLMEDGKPIWDLQWSPDISDDDWYVLMATFDWVVIPPQLVDRVAVAFDNFYLRVPPGTVNHSKEYAAEMRKATIEVEGCRGIAFSGTSVNSNPWYVREPIECDDSECDKKPLSEGKKECYNCSMLDYDRRPYNLDRDEKHFFLTTREEWQKQKDDEYGESKAVKYLKEHLGKAMFEDALMRVAKLIEGGEELMEVDATGFLNKVAEALERWDKIAEDQRTELMGIDEALGLAAGDVGFTRVEEIRRLREDRDVADGMCDAAVDHSTQMTMEKIVRAELECTTPMNIVEPGKVPFPRDPEPYAVLTCGDVEIRLGLTYFHHLVLCRGWGDRDSSYFAEDMKMHAAVSKIRKLLFDASKDVPFYPCDMGCGLGEGIHPRPIEQDGAGNITKVAWVCPACDQMGKKLPTPIRYYSKEEKKE